MKNKHSNEANPHFVVGESSVQQVDRRPDARIARDALDEVREIQKLLADVYTDTGDGRTLLRELIQNADDAGAGRLVFAVLAQGLQNATNSLLQGPALLIVNDGPFSAEDHKGLHRAIGGSKGNDTSKVGRFGLGLKSLFHICEALIYVGFDGGITRPGALNPWAGTGNEGDADPIHPDWDGVVDSDLELLVSIARTLLDNFERGLFLWVPLRHLDHLDRAEDSTHGLGKTIPTPDEIAAWFGRPTQLALLLAQCGHLSSIDAIRLHSPTEIKLHDSMARVTRSPFARRSWVGRPEDDAVPAQKKFIGQLQASNQFWSVSGVESLGLESLRLLRSLPEWPRDLQYRDGRAIMIPQKALAHAAVTVLRPNHISSEHCGARLRWAVFLPLDDDPNPRSSEVVEVVGRVSDPATWDIIMHGYFLPSHDRRSIPGVTNDEYGTGDTAARSRWNRAVRDELLLPLIPSALADAVTGIPETVAWQVLDVVVKSRTIADHVSTVTRNHSLLPIITQEGISWVCRDIKNSCILSIPGWTQAPDKLRQNFVECVNGTTENIIFIDGDAPRIGGQTSTWPSEWLVRLLECIPSDNVNNYKQLLWIKKFISDTITSSAPGYEERSCVIARWLAERLGEGALSPNSDPAIREDLRAAWRSIMKSLPDQWLVEVPVASHYAVSEIARQGLLGVGLLTIPISWRQERNSTARPDASRIDKALAQLGDLLCTGQKSSQHVKNARLILAETLLSVRGAQPLDDKLSKLPILRAHRLPEGRNEAWSIDDLRRNTERWRVFARTCVDEGSDSIALESASAPKQAAKELAEAIGADVWIVDDIVAKYKHTPTPTTTELATAVIQTSSICSPVSKRLALLQRLGQGDVNSVVQRAARTLLTGRIFPHEEAPELYYVRSQDSEKEENRKTLAILLRLLGKAWSAVEAELVEPLPVALVNALRVKTVDAGVLHYLLGVCVVGTTHWTQLEQHERLHLLLRLHSTVADSRARWRAMPLHRRASGERGSFDKQALRVVGEKHLPPKLESEVLLLDPDREVANLYLDVPALDDDGVLRAMLKSKHPYLFAEDIVRLLSPEEGRINLPRDSTLCDLLRDALWLPHGEDISGIAPSQVLIVPDELRSKIGPLVTAGAVGEYRLHEEVVASVWIAAEKVVHEIFVRQTQALQIKRLCRAINPALVAAVAGGAYLILPDAARVSQDLLKEALQSPLASSHRGWVVVRTAADILKQGPERPLHDAVLEIARSLCAPIPPTFQVSALMAVAATCPPKESPSGRLFCNLLDSFAQTSDFTEHVLPRLELPTQDGRWQHASSVARSASGVARRHRVLSELRSPLRLDSGEHVSVKTSAGVQVGAGAVKVLSSYFEPWANRLPHGAVGAFLGLLGNGKDSELVRLAEVWLGGDVSVERIRRELAPTVEQDPCATIKVFVSSQISQGQLVNAVNLLGEYVEMSADSDNNTIFATDPERCPSICGDFWRIGLRDVEPRLRTAHELVALLGGAVEWWAVWVLRLDPQLVRVWWSRWGTGSQAQIGPVRASILAHLPLTLHQLDVRDCAALRDALDEAQRAQRRREQAPEAQSRDAMITERKAFKRLDKLICNSPEHQHFLWSRVQELMRRFGYRDDSVLMELAQNADDALSQAAEIAHAPLPLVARRLVVRVYVREGVTTIDVVHHGRPINDTGGAAFPRGRERQWDQDLYFMMLLNLSGKPGEMPGQASVAATTGKFGLGFKSVHLVSENPSVVSGFVAFSIAGGLLPFEQPVPDDPDLLPAQEHRATRMRLPLRKGADEREILRRFAYTRALLPVFARQLREVVVDGGSFAGVSTFDPQPLNAAAGWSLATTTVEVYEHGQWRILRFRPADGGRDAQNSTVALAVGLKDGKPAPLPAALPFLWNVTPTSENWGCGYAVNGPFKLDPGRTHVSLDDDMTCRVVDLLGKSLGSGLVELHDALLGGTNAALLGLSDNKDLADFLAALWRVLASGIEAHDEMRQELLRRLHGPDRGLSFWMSARSVVPSDLPPPFLERLPALNTGVRLEVAGASLANPYLCKVFSEISGVADLAKKHPIVSAGVAQSLRLLLGQEIRQFDASDLLAELAESWDQLLTPARLHSLRPLAADTVLQAMTKDVWHTQLSAKTIDGHRAPLRELLLPREVTVEHVDADIRDEQLRAAFAPDRCILAADYIVQPDDLALFIRLRVRHQIDARTMANWYSNLSPDKRPAALRYLLRGKLQQEVMQLLVRSEDRPSWLDDYNTVQGLLAEIGDERWRSQGLLSALFPDHFQGNFFPIRLPLLSETTKHNFFEQLEDWWNDEDNRCPVIQSYEAEAWPNWLLRDGIAQGLQSGSHDHWLALLVLGACRSLGRAEASHHRSFLESAHSEGWWDVFKRPDDVHDWMSVLRTWQDKGEGSLAYPRWMSLFPYIYQLSRYLEKYKTLLTSVARRPPALYDVTSLLAPRVDEALTGAGQHFDAPPAPLNMGLHWVLRELVRVGVLDGSHIFPDCWMPSERIIRFLQPLGLEPPADELTNSKRARVIFDFLASKLNEKSPNLHRAFDIPLRHIDSSKDLRQKFGLEEK
jgi:hypothetical protein